MAEFDFLRLHGDGVARSGRIAEMVRQTRRIPGYRPKPILFNEGGHFDLDRPENNFEAALSEGAPWGYFDPGANDYRDGYQSPRVEWGIDTPWK